MRILGDVAPYSREYQREAGIVHHQSKDDPELRAEYERIQEQVRQARESTLQTAQKHFNAPVDTVEGTVKSVSGSGVELEEYPGRTFRFSSVGLSMADLTAESLGGPTRPGPSPAPHTKTPRARGRGPPRQPAGPARKSSLTCSPAGSPASPRLTRSAETGRPDFTCSDSAGRGVERQLSRQEDPRKVAITVQFASGRIFT